MQSLIDKKTIRLIYIRGLDKNPRITLAYAPHPHLLAGRVVVGVAIRALMDQHSRKRGSRLAMGRMFAQAEGIDEQGVFKTPRGAMVMDIETLMGYVESWKKDFPSAYDLAGIFGLLPHSWVGRAWLPVTDRVELSRIARIEHALVRWILEVDAPIPSLERVQEAAKALHDAGQHLLSVIPA